MMALHFTFSYQFTIKHFISRPAEKESSSRDVMITLRLGCYFKRKKTAYISTGWRGFWIKVFQNKILLFSRVLDFPEEIFNPRSK